MPRRLDRRPPRRARRAPSGRGRAGAGPVDAFGADTPRAHDPFSRGPFSSDPFTADPFDPTDPFASDPFASDPFAPDPFAPDPFGPGEPIDWLDRPERASLADRARELVRARVGPALGGGRSDGAQVPVAVVVLLSIVVGLLVVGALVVPRVLGGGSPGATATARSGTATAGIESSGTLPLTDGVPSSSGVGASSPAAALDGLPVVTVPSPPATTVMIRVHVAGAVARPGVYSLSSDARVIDAARLAGGTTAELDPDAVNLAAPVADGERVFLPRRGRAVPAVAPTAGSGPASVGPASVGGSGATSTGASSSGPVSVNTASADELDGLPGIGPALAQRIVEFRAAHGGFRSVDQLLDVPGIGDAKLASLRSKVRV